MSMSRRSFLSATAVGGLGLVGCGKGSSLLSSWSSGEPKPDAGAFDPDASMLVQTDAAVPDAPQVIVGGGPGFRKQLTGAALASNTRWQVAGTDLGIPYVLDNGSIGYLFGDSFNTMKPEGPPLPNDWRSPVMLRSGSHPDVQGGIVFSSAAGVTGNGRAPEIMRNGHNGIGIDNVWEVTVIPTDGVGFSEIGRQVVSYMSVENWDVANGARWKTNYAGLAYSDDGGNTFTRSSFKWWNDAQNSNPFQMWTMQRDGAYVYVFTVRSGRQVGPMMLMRVPWQNILDQNAYEGWGWNGTNWGWGRPCTPILEGHFGEPSVRRLANGTWAMSYLNCATGKIVTRTAAGPDRPWSAEKVQVTSAQEPELYGGFIHPWSATGANKLHLMVSTWKGAGVNTTAYHVSHYAGTL